MRTARKTRRTLPTQRPAHHPQGEQSNNIQYPTRMTKVPMIDFVTYYLPPLQNCLRGTALPQNDTVLRKGVDERRILFFLNFIYSYSYYCGSEWCPPTPRPRTRHFEFVQPIKTDKIAKSPANPLARD
jgi:hypothetical protein